MIRENILTKCKQTLLVTGFVCALFFSKAQTLFNNTYTCHRPKVLFSSAIYIDTGYIFLGNTSTLSSPFYETGILVKLNADGIITHYVTNSDTLIQRTGFLWNTLLSSSTGKLVFSGNGADTGQHLAFGFADKNLDSMQLYRYKSPSIFSYQGLALVEYSSNSFYVTGVHNIQSSFNANMLLAKIDSNGNKLWEKYYDQKASDYGKSLIVLANGNLMLGAERNDLNQTNVKSNTWLLEVDTGGNVVRQWFDPSDSTYVAEGLRQTQDGGFIYGAQKRVYQVAGSLGFTATVVKMDSNFNKQWVYEGGVLGTYTGVVDIELLPDGSYVACGNYSNKEAWVIKFTEAGQVVWLRKYKGLTDTTATWNLLSDIDVLPDGGVIAVGQCQRVVNPNNLTPQVGWFLKLDSNGCEVENCLVGIDPQPATGGETAMQVWPNPTKNVLCVTLEAELIGATVAVYDMAGKLQLSTQTTVDKTPLNISALSNGLYVVVASKGEKTARAKLIIE